MKMSQTKTLSPMSQAKSLWFSLFSKKVSLKKKWMAAAIILYIVSPIDIIPDFIPLVGYADDILLPIVLFLANKFILNDPNAVLTDGKEKKV